MINEDIAQEILDELFSSLAALETQSAAILQFLMYRKNKIPFRTINLGYIDLEEKTLQPLENPFGPKV